MLRRPCLVGVLLLLLAAAPSRAQIPEFDESAAWEYLVAQVEFGPRVPGSDAHRACLDWMLEHLRKTADRVVPHSFVMQDPYSEARLQLTNVQASFRPELDDRIAIGAHWDTRPRADMDTSENADQPIPGANDGASGVAILLALADLLAETPPTVGVDLLFFDGEDWGMEGDPAHYLLGSRRFVQDFPRYRPRALVLLDLVGDADLSIPMEGYSLRAAPSLTRMVFERAQILGLSAFEPVEGRAVMDDHIPFLQARIPAVNLIDFDYPPWHTLADTPDKCSPESLDQVGTLVVHLIFEDFAVPQAPASGPR